MIGGATTRFYPSMYIVRAVGPKKSSEECLALRIRLHYYSPSAPLRGMQNVFLKSCEDAAKKNVCFI